MRYIKFAAEFCCSPLWGKGEEMGNIDPNDLPISEDLKNDIVTWADLYDDTLDWNYPPDSGFLSIDAKNAFEEEGWRLVARLREELGVDFVVEAKIRGYVKDNKTTD